jgi:hypothetical protein
VICDRIIVVLLVILTIDDIIDILYHAFVCVCVCFGRNVILIRCNVKHGG